MFSGLCMYLCAENDWKLKLSMQTHILHFNTLFENGHASMNQDNVDVCI